MALTLAILYFIFKQVKPEIREVIVFIDYSFLRKSLKIV